MKNNMSNKINDMIINNVNNNKKYLYDDRVWEKYRNSLDIKLEFDIVSNDYKGLIEDMLSLKLDDNIDKLDMKLYRTLDKNYKCMISNKNNELLSVLEYRFYKPFGKEKLKREYINNMIGSFDIETTSGFDHERIIGVSWIMKPLEMLQELSVNDNLKINTTLITDVTNADIYDESCIYQGYNMLIECLKDMCVKANNYTFYCHNLSGFDSVYIISALIKYTRVKGSESDITFKIIRREAKVLKITVRYIDESGKESQIVILDSLLVLNASLRKLSQLFELEHQKGYLPYDWVSTNLNYIGPIPQSFNDDVKAYLLELFPNGIMNTKIALKTYLDTDVRLLLIIMDKFKNIIYSTARVDLTKCITISKLALSIYSNMCHDETKKIPLISSTIDDTFIRKALFGGYNNVINPIADEAYYYDVNSFYPAVAVKYRYPTTKGFDISYPEGLDYKDFNYPETLGVLHCKVETPKYLVTGVLPVKDINKGVIFPLGHFLGILTTVELDYALSLGYKITVCQGMIFNSMESPYKKVYRFL